MLGERFETYARETSFDIERICADFGLDPTRDANDISQQLNDIRNLDLSEGKAFLGREEIYAYLLGIKLQKGDDPFRPELIGKMSPTRSAIRDLFDIRYATNLSDVLDRFSIRGDGVRSRSILQNDMEMAKGAVAFDESQFQTISENIRLANFEFEREEVGVILPEKLTVDDIFAIRGMACCRFDGHQDRLIHATPASRSKSMGLRYPMVECLRIGL